MDIMTIKNFKEKSNTEIIKLIMNVQKIEHSKNRKISDLSI